MLDVKIIITIELKM